MTFPLAQPKECARCHLRITTNARLADDAEHLAPLDRERDTALPRT
jgi:hypothetical protein